MFEAGGSQSQPPSLGRGGNSFPASGMLQPAGGIQQQFVPPGGEGAEFSGLPSRQLLQQQVLKNDTGV